MIGGRRRGGRAGRSLVQAAALLSLLPLSRLAAQDQPRQVTAFLKGLHTGLCVEFLVAPEAVRGQIGGGVSAAPIESVAEAHPALARVARDEAAYQGWIPAEYCWFLYREGVVGGKRVVKEDGRQPVAVGYLAVAARDLPGGAEQLVITFFTNAGRLEGALDNARFRADEIDLTLGLIPAEEDSPTRRRYTARHGHSTIQWDGGPGTPRPVEPRLLRLLGRTSSGGNAEILVTITPDSSWSASGTLKVSGEGELQRLMAPSPIRLVTTFFRGGDSDWEFGER